MSTQKQNLQLTCIITGKSRFTNTAYLEKKAAAAKKKAAAKKDKLLGTTIKTPTLKDMLKRLKK